jgi:hypothetical protein
VYVYMKRELTINIANKDPINAITKAAVQLTENCLADKRTLGNQCPEAVKEMLTKEWKS